MRDAIKSYGRPPSAPVVESLENRQLFALALVHQELHRPPMALVTNDGTPPSIAQPTVGVELSRAGLLNGPMFGFDVYSPDGKGGYLISGQYDVSDQAPGIDIDSAVAAGDLNGDGFTDVALKLFSVTGQPTPVGEATNERIVPFFNTGKGTFVEGATIPLGESFIFSFGGKKGYDYYRSRSGLAIGDVDADGVGDIVSWTLSNTTTLLMDAVSRGPRQTISLDSGPFKSDDSRILGLADLDGDGHADLIGYDGGTKSVIVRGWDPKQKQAIVSVATPKDLRGPVTDIRVGDWNGDGLVDLVLFSDNRYAIGINGTKSPTSTSLPVYSFSWGTAQTLARPLTSDDIGAGDVDGDGLTDLFVIHRDPPGGRVTIVK